MAAVWENVGAKLVLSQDPGWTLISVTNIYRVIKMSDFYTGIRPAGVSGR